MNFYSKFKADPYYLQKYYLKALTVLIPLVCVSAMIFEVNIELLYYLPLFFICTIFRGMILSVFFSTLLLLYLGYELSLLKVTLSILCGVYLGVWSTVLIHNASHGNIQNKTLNRIVGEICGYQLLTSFPLFSLIHLEHHRYPDDLKKDPQAYENNTSFWYYLNNSTTQMRNVFFDFYTETWGEDKKYLNSWKKIIPFILLSKILRCALLFIILGPVYFTFTFMISHLTTHTYFSAINYFTHKYEDNECVILNLNENLISKVLNHFFAGALFHKNHHEKPKLFNPMSLEK